jgi:hypothetical protein
MIKKQVFDSTCGLETRKTTWPDPETNLAGFDKVGHALLDRHRKIGLVGSGFQSGRFCVVQRPKLYLLRLNSN